MDSAPSEDRAPSEGVGLGLGLPLSQSCPPPDPPDPEPWPSSDGVVPPGGTGPDLCSLSLSPVCALGAGLGLVSSVSAPSVSVSVASSSISGLALGFGLGLASGLSLGSALGLAEALALAEGLGLWSSSGLAELTASTADVPAERLEWDAETARDPTTIAEPAIASAAARRVPTRAIAFFKASVIAYLLLVSPVPEDTFTCRTPTKAGVTIPRLRKNSAALIARECR